MATSEDLETWILHGREERWLEYKQSYAWANTRGMSSVQARCVKTILAMANLADGGVIVIGVEKQGDNYTPTGMPSDHFASLGQDGVSASVNEYAAPFVDLTVTKHTGQAQEIHGRQFVIIEVATFAEAPIICRRDGPEGLEQGRVYVRSRRMAETAPVRYEEEMRELLERATQRKVDREIGLLRERLETLGIQLPEAQDIDAKRFEEQLGGL